MVDFDFIAALEGNELNGYVPDAIDSKSGVTIGMGFDLGCRSPKELYKAFPDFLAHKLVAYCNKQGVAALSYLNQHPLTCSPCEVAIINAYAKQAAIRKLQKRWNKSSSKTAFKHLPWQVQTVLASVSFQYGNMRKRTPNFWRQTTKGQWHDALKNLRNFGDRYDKRRNKEADLLESWLDNLQ